MKRQRENLCWRVFCNLSVLAIIMTGITYYCYKIGYSVSFVVDCAKFRSCVLSENQSEKLTRRKSKRYILKSDTFVDPK